MFSFKSFWAIKVEVLIWREIKDFRDQIYLQIKTSTLIAQKDLKENITNPQPKVKKVTEFGNTLKSSLIQYLE
jgi:hypothetical protein